MPEVTHLFASLRVDQEGVEPCQGPAIAGQPAPHGALRAFPVVRCSRAFGIAPLVDQEGVEPSCSSLSERCLDRSASGL